MITCMKGSYLVIKLRGRLIDFETSISGHKVHVGWDVLMSSSQNESSELYLDWLGENPSIRVEFFDEDGHLQKKQVL